MTTKWMEGKDVKKKCELIYCGPRPDRKGQRESTGITDRTWRNWKRRCKVPPSTPQRGDWLTEMEAKKLIVLAYLKRRNPNGVYAYGDILGELFNPDPDWQARLNAIAYAPTAAIIRPAFGRDLPKLIQDLTGCGMKVESIQRKLYRAAKQHKKEFSFKKFYPADQVNWWISVVYPDFIAA